MIEIFMFALVKHFYSIKKFNEIYFLPFQNWKCENVKKIPDITEKTLNDRSLIDIDSFFW